MQPGSVAALVSSAIMNLAEGMAPINEFVAGQKKQLVEAGIGPDTADEMVRGLYEQLVGTVFAQVQQARRGPGKR